MICYIFDTESDAIAGEQTITGNIREWVRANHPDSLTPEGHLRSRNAATGQLTDWVTVRWATPWQRTDGKWVVTKPTANEVLPVPIDAVLDGVVAAEEEWSSSWLPEGEP